MFFELKNLNKIKFRLKLYSDNKNIKNMGFKF